MPMRRISFFIPPEFYIALMDLKKTHGIPEAESIRRAIAAYLAEKGVLKGATSKTPRTKSKKKS
jgi:hypothetical protein